MSTNNEFGVAGLGRLGGNLARHTMEKNIRVVGFTRSQSPADMLTAGMVEIRNLADFHAKLSSPRAVFLYIPAGPMVDQLIDDLALILEAGDIIVDGGNSYWGDSIRRHRRLQKKRIHLVDLGTSGALRARGISPSRSTTELSLAGCRRSAKEWTCSSLFATGSTSRTCCGAGGTARSFARGSSI